MGSSRKRRPGIYLEPEWLDSRAFQDLSGTALKVLLALLRKRCFQRVRRKRGKGDKVCVNADHLVLTTAEILREYGISSGRFQRALNQLHEHGWIDVVEIGGGLHGRANVYGLSERWRDYRKPGFVKKPRPKDQRRIGNRGKGF